MSNVRETSTYSYDKIKPTIGKRQKVVLLAFVEYGAVTNLEISTWKQIPINQVTPRTNELVKMGFMIEGEKRECSISGRTSFTWIRTNKEWTDMNE
jgi:hypothetical protein